MKHLLLTTIAAVLVVGCRPSVDIHQPAKEGDIEAVKQHLAAGVDVNAKNDWGETPLHYAAYWGHKEIAELLITKGADVNAKNRGGYTPLHSAAYYGQKEVAELLIAEGANVNVKRDNGETPLDAAIINNKTETADLLRKHGGKSGAEDSIHLATRTGNIEAVKQHLDAGTDVNAMDFLFLGTGRTSLHFAANKGHKEIAELLIAKGADVNTKNENGVTPLDLAKRHSKVADLLRKHGGKTKNELVAEGK